MVSGMSARRTITITEDDLERLGDVIALYGDAEGDAVDALEQALEAATVVTRDAVHASIVTMSSRVICRRDDGESRELELVYPDEADPERGRVSVLAPLGRALLGARVGDRLEIPSGKQRRAWIVEAVRFQPEAAELAR